MGKCATAQDTISAHAVAMPAELRDHLYLHCHGPWWCTSNVPHMTWWCTSHVVVHLTCASHDVVVHLTCASAMALPQQWLLCRA